jgi:hypothetical protein
MVTFSSAFHYSFPKRHSGEGKEAYYSFNFDTPGAMLNPMTMDVRVGTDEI